ncbi:MAG: hypothetical protein KGJ13_01225 [Patescibacteria group bacterium]|nr:hypothetical protein [Patescibacteria group bacterium]
METLGEYMQIERLEITKGPDRWLLAESLFHDEDYPGEAPRPRFTTQWNGKEAHLLVAVTNIGRYRAEEGGAYSIRGVCKIVQPRPHQVLLEQVPIEINYSAHTRKGFAQVSF